MYVPAHFAADDGLVSELLTRHGAADLVTNTSQGLLATMLPFIHDPAAGEHGALLGHLARNNDQWKVPAIGDVERARPRRSNPAPEPAGRTRRLFRRRVPPRRVTAVGYRPGAPP